MGEVLLADDLLLKRKVAIKIVHRSALSNPRAEKLLRREAKAAAALDNPFICKVYEVGEDEGRVFIAMEYIQGETLRQRMLRSAIPLREVLSLAREIADGLDEADRKRIIHRDLKPSNIIITPQGHVKIMDFGLAKRLPGDESVEESSAGTPDGMVVGTREYMSPEQLRGKPLESSSDLFALGLILFEMAAGHHPFKKPSAIDTQFAILNEMAPDLGEACSTAPDELCDLVDGLLKKTASDRPRIGEVRERLADISDPARPEAKETLGTSASVEAFVARKPRLVMAMGSLLVLALLALSIWTGLRPEAVMPQAKMATLVTWPSNEEHAVLSPDSKSVSFMSNRDGVTDLWLMDLSGGEPRRLTHAPGNLTSQLFSEDGVEIAYTLESEGQKLFQTVRIDGGPPTRSLSLPTDTRILRLIRWVGDSVFMETQNRDLVKLSLNSGTLTRVQTLPLQTRRPAGFDVSRDGRSITFSAANEDGSKSIWLKPQGEDPRSLTRGGFQDEAPFFSDALAERRIFFESDRSGQEDLWLMERPGREPRQITFGSNREFIESVSPDGSTLIFSEVLEGASIFSFDLSSGSRSQLTAENRRDITPTVSEDGQIAFARVSLASNLPWSESSILLGQLADSRLVDARVVLREGWNPVLSPNGKWVAYQLLHKNASTPRLNLLNIENAHSRDMGELPPSSRYFMAFPWYFGARHFQWSDRNELWFVEGNVKDGSRILRLEPGSGLPPSVVVTLKPGEIASSLLPDRDGLGLLYVRSENGKPGASLEQFAAGRGTHRWATPKGLITLLGRVGATAFFTSNQAGEDQVEILSMDAKVVKTRFHLAAKPSTLRLLPGLNALSFSRVDARDVENVFLKRLDTLAETMVTANGIQGVGFSPVSAVGSQTLVFSQQLKNKDLGIIRLDRP
jgi:Tol biopolymer transport system component